MDAVRLDDLDGVKVLGCQGGEVCRECRTEREVRNEDDTDFIAGVLDQLAVALENARLIMDTQRQAGLELKLSEIAIKIAQANNIDEVLRSTVEELAVIPNVNEITLQMLPNDSRNSNNRSVFGGAA